MRIVQVVRRFGPVGGMEEYVWCLTKSLTAILSEPVQVLCESNDSEPIAGTNLEMIPPTSVGPRWYRLWRFSNYVNQWRNEQSLQDTIIHSHEFSCGAEVLTFHTTVHGAGEQFGVKCLDPSWHLNQWRERTVLHSPQLCKIVPVSALLSRQLKKYHPRCEDKLAEPIPPGVKLAHFEKSSAHQPTIGFIGREWNRKGMRQVVDIFREMLLKNKDTKLVLAGMPKAEIGEVISGLEDQVEIMGWIDNKSDFYDRIQLLIHPARLEAFGMVVTEAMTRGIPVLVSDQVGAASEVTSEFGKVMPLQAPLEDWVRATKELLSASSSVGSAYSRTWERVADEYAVLYEKISSSR